MRRQVSATLLPPKTKTKIKTLHRYTKEKEKNNLRFCVLKIQAHCFYNGALSKGFFHLNYQPGCDTSVLYIIYEF